MNGYVILTVRGINHVTFRVSLVLTAQSAVYGNTNNQKQMSCFLQIYVKIDIFQNMFLTKWKLNTFSVKCGGEITCPFPSYYGATKTVDALFMNDLKFPGV